MDRIQIVTQDTLFPPRKRAFKPKSSTGCKTCRIRRIKCDELRPYCTQCSRGHRICDGYIFAAPKNPQTQVSLHSLTPKSVRVSAIGPYLAPTLFKTAKESRSFDFFLHRTVSKLSGSFKSEFWDQLILQAVHHEHAIRHAAVALGALHESLENDNKEGPRLLEKQEDNAFALQHYVKAIGFLVAPAGESTSSQAANVALMTCVLFVCFEVLRGYHGAALSHIGGGIKIFSELQNSKPTSLPHSTNPYAPLSVFNPILSRLDNQASQVTYNRPRNRLSNSAFGCETYSRASDNIPATFSSVEEARRALDGIYNATLRAPHSSVHNADFSQREPKKTQMTTGLVRDLSTLRLKQWSSALSNFVQRQNGNLSADQQTGIHILKVKRVLMGINFRVDFVEAAENEMLWDECILDFATIITYAKKVLESEVKGVGNHGKRQLPVFTLDTEIILPLYFVATKCRDGTVRREAIALLKYGERQEGIWNAAMAARVADRLVEIEEEGLDVIDGTVKKEDVKRERRVQGVEVRWEIEHRRASLKYTRLHEESGGMGVVKEWVEW